MKIRRVLLHFFPRYAVGRMVIYGKLMRIDKPIGTLLLLWPTYWALWVFGRHSGSGYFLGVYRRYVLYAQRRLRDQRLC